MSDYAPNPEAQDIYKGLAQQRLSEVTASQITNLTNPVFLQAENQDDLITMNIINQAAMRNGAPMPNTFDVFKIEVDTSGAGVAKFGDDLSEVPQGEVWQIYGFSISPSGVSGSVSVEVRIFGPSGSSTEFLSGSSSSGSSYPLQEDFGPFYIGAGSKIQFESTGTFTTMQLRYCAIRVR
jgi:hypothetical protein